MAGEQFRAHAARVGTFHVPALRLADGRCLTESVAICRYLEALHARAEPDGPRPARGGGDRDVAAPDRVPAAAADRLRAAPRQPEDGGDGGAVPTMGRGQSPAGARRRSPASTPGLPPAAFVAGDRFTIADITALVAVDFLKPTRIAVPDGLRAALARLAAGLARPRAVARGLSMRPATRAADLAALAWQVELGADEAIAEAPINRFDRAAAAARRAAAARPPPRPLRPTAEPPAASGAGGGLRRSRGAQGGDGRLRGLRAEARRAQPGLRRRRPARRG